MSDNQLSEQIQKLAEHLKFIEKKLDQLIEASERQPASNEGPRRDFQQRPGGFRPNNYGQGGGFRPNGGNGGFRPNGGAPSGSGYRPSRPAYGQGGGARPQGNARPYEGGGRGEGRPQQGGGERPSGQKPFYSKYQKNRNRNDR